MSGSCDGCGGVCGECYCDEIAEQEQLQETPAAVRWRKAVGRFRFLWHEYVEADPATLTADAKALRARIIDLVEP